MYDNIKLAVFGVGNWGKNHLKTAMGILPKSNITIVDPKPNPKNLAGIDTEGLTISNDPDAITNHPVINTAIVATPAETHFDLAKKLLLAGKDVLVEKPMTLYSHESEELVTIANDAGRILMVGHVLLYHPAIQKIKDEINCGRIGNIQYLYSNRLNHGTLRTEENILWSFAPHDISVFQYLLEAFPTSIKSMGASFITKNIEDTTLTYFNYPSNIHAHIFVSWLNPFKEQKLVVIGSKGMLVFDDTLKEGKVKFHPKGFTNIKGHFEKFDGEPEILEIDTTPPLLLEQKAFYESCLTRKKPFTDGEHGLQVLKILETAHNQLKENNG